jgi:hypothetical protein
MPFAQCLPCPSGRYPPRSPARSAWESPAPGATGTGDHQGRDHQDRDHQGRRLQTLESITSRPQALDQQALNRQALNQRARYQRDRGPQVRRRVGGWRVDGWRVARTRMEDIGITPGIARRPCGAGEINPGARPRRPAQSDQPRGEGAVSPHAHMSAAAGEPPGAPFNPGCAACRGFLRARRWPRRSRRAGSRDARSAPRPWSGRA